MNVNAEPIWFHSRTQYCLSIHTTVVADVPLYNVDQTVSISLIDARLLKVIKPQLL